jgi:hypothetical protein
MPEVKGFSQSISKKVAMRGKCVVTCMYTSQGTRNKGGMKEGHERDNACMLCKVECKPS